jgi:isoquinoline 1-oxidoreductase beta subunit
MTPIVNLSRRNVVKGLAGMTGLVLGFHVGPRIFPFAEAAVRAKTFEPNVYLAIDETGLVTIAAHRSEMGTGIRTGLPMVLADELEADWTRVRIVQAQGDPKYGDQNTDGSRSTRQFYQPMREAGASARQMLEAAAAHVWGVNANDCRARNHMVVHTPTGRQLSFGDAAKVAATLQVPPADHLELRFKPASERRYVGKPMPIVDLANIVRGKATYGIDFALPGMKYASVERCPVYGGKALSFDAADALKVPGVERVVAIAATPIPSGFNPLGGIAVIASNTWAAQQGRQRLKITWDFGPNANHDSSAYRAELEATARKPGQVVRDQGKVDEALASSAQRISADYFVPYYAHAPMEVPTAVANVVGNKCEIWAPTQFPQAARATVLGGSASSVRERHRQRDLAGWCLRPQVEAGLYRGGRLAIAGGPSAGEGDVDARGRDSARLLSRDLCPARRGRARGGRQRHRMASSDGVSGDRIDVPTGRDLRQRRRAPAGRYRHALRDRERSLREWARRQPCSHRMVSIGLQHPTRLRGMLVRRRACPCGG